MTIRKKGGGRSKEVATTASSSSGTVEVVSSSVVEEARRVVESESRSSVLEVTSREVITDSKGNVIVESAPQTTSTRRDTGKKSCQDFLSKERTRSVGHDVKSAGSVERSVNGASYESRESSSKTTYEETTRDGRTSTSRIHETTGEWVDDGGRVTSARSRSVETTSVEAPSEARVKFDARERGGDSPSKEERRVIGEVATRCNKPGQSTWDGTFVSESPSKGLVSKAGGARESSSSVEISESRQSFIDQRSTVVRDSEDTIDFAGPRVDACRKGPRSRSKPGESAWDGTFVIEKTPEPRKRNAFESTGVFLDGERASSVEASARRREEGWSRDGEEREKRRSTHDSSRLLSEERRRDGVVSPPGRRAARPGESSWNGGFEEGEDGKGRSTTTSLGEKTVVRRSEKRHDSDVDVQDVTEEQNASTVSESSVSSSYIVEYATATDERRKTVEKASSVSAAILEEDSGEIRRFEEEGRRSSAEEKRGARDTRSQKPGRSTWDGSFVNAGRKPCGKSIADSTIVIRDVTGDNSINEAEISTASYVVEHSSSQQSFTDIRDSSLSSVHETIVYDVVQPTRAADSSSRPETPERIGKRDAGIAKPGSSTWDGTFVAERSTRRGGAVDKVGDSPVPRSRKHVADTTLDIRDTTERISKVFSNSIVMEQSTVHHSYSDSSNLDYSTSSVETVIVRDGVPTAVQKSVTIEEGRADLEKKAVDRKPSPRLAETSPGKSERPSKPGASAWDGSFVREKPVDEKKPSTDDVSRRQADKGEAPRSPTDLGKLRKDEEPKAPYVSEKSITVTDASKETSEFLAETTLERTTLVTDTSEILDSSKYSATVVREIGDEEPRREPAAREPAKDGKGSLEKDRPTSPEKVDRSSRPTKPGASTWDGSFVYEKDRKKPIEKGPARDAEDGARPTSLERDTTKISMEKHVTDKKDSTDIDVARSSYVIDQSSSFTSVQDVRDAVEERVIGEFTRDTRKDVVSNE